MLSNRFRWVYCQLVDLRPCFPSNLRRMLEELPKSLDGTYQRILKEINNANRIQAHQALQCLAVAQRPLRVEELAEVLALDVDTGGIPTFNANLRLEDHEAAVLSACSSLVSVINHDDYRVVRFSHFSVKEFLTSDRLASMGDVSQFYIADEPSHAILAQACLGVSMDVRTSKNSLKDFALFAYADKYWSSHARVGEVELRIKDALNCVFNLDDPHFEALIRRSYYEDFYRHFRVPSDKDPKGVLTSAAPFFVAGQGGLRCLAERLIVSNQQQIIGFQVHGWTLLHLHLIMANNDSEHVEIARLLLSYGADINSRPEYATRSPPHIASLQSQSHVERLVDGTDQIENSPQIGSSDVSSESSEESSGDGFDFGSNKKFGFTPLHISVSNGHLNMCQMLLEHKADVRAQDNQGNTPLHLAASEGHLEVVRVLLEYRADVNALNMVGLTPLHCAFESLRVDIVRLLVNHGADAKVNDKSGNTFLHLAASAGDLELARMVIERNVDVNSPNNDGLTALFFALESENFDVARLFLDHNADVHVRDERGNTPLHVAAAITGNGHLDICRMLLERKAEVNSRNHHESTPLLIASELGGPELVQLFLDHNADPHARDGDGDTLLHCAAIAGWLEVVRLLLKLNVEVNSRNNVGSTPLHLASAGCLHTGGNPDVVRLLLDHGSDMQIRNLDGKTASQVARGRKQQEIVQLLSLHAAG